MGSKIKQSSLFDSNFFVKDPNRKARSLVRKITHSGETELNKDDLVELKNICKASPDELMIDVYKEFMKCLRKEHSQVRVSATQLIDYLFQKSHLIRKRLLDDFDIFIELTLAISQRKTKLQLPPPKKYAALLRELTAKTIHRWHADFGDGYEKLRYAHRYLREHQLVDFSRFQVNTYEQLLKQQKLVEHQEKVLSRSIENRLKEYEELKPEISKLLAQIESLVDLLVPSDDQVAAPEADDFNPNSHCQQHGIANLSQNILIEFSPYIEVIRNDDNRDLVQTLRELKKELVKDKLVKLIAIEKIFNKRSDQLLNTLKEIIDLKNRSTNVVLKLGELKIVNIEEEEVSNSKNTTLDADPDDSDDDGDFEEVAPKADLETYIPKSLRFEYGLEPIDPKELDMKNRTILSDDSFSLDVPKPGTSNERAGGSGFAISCNVRLESGKLCPRRDRVKCPFHGKIILRDHLGVPIDEEARLEEEERTKKRNNVPEWQDPDLLAEIRAATGVDLTMPKRGGKSNKISPRKNLANPRTCDQTSKQRLERRLKSLMK